MHDRTVLRQGVAVVDGRPAYIRMETPPTAVDCAALFTLDEAQALAFHSWAEALLNPAVPQVGCAFHL